jgi:hypothetical protein
VGAGDDAKIELLKMPGLAATLAHLENIMKIGLCILVVTAFAIVGGDPASARAKRHVKITRCADQPTEFSWRLIRPAPQPNGCSPVVYQHNNYVGQDPDANIRFQLRRDPQSGYSSGQY